MSRRVLVAGNWKMFLEVQQARGLARDLVDGLRTAGLGPGIEVVVFPSAPLLAAVAGELAGSEVGLGGQDLHPQVQGAFTGDVAGGQLRSIGCGWVLCGHSERRRDHGETDALVAAKLGAALAAGLQPIACVGETLEQRRAGDTEQVLAAQIAALLAPGSVPEGQAWVEPVIAYEPVWAIGTGEVASPGQVEAAHRGIRERVAFHRGAQCAAATRILYGGSVKPDNVDGLGALEGVDGFLVGGASLDVASFLAIIIRSARRADPQAG